MVSLRVAAILLCITAAGFGLPCIAAIRNLLTGGEGQAVQHFGEPSERSPVAPAFR